MVHLAGNWNALLQKLVVEDISHLLSEKHFNSLDSLRRNWKPLLMNVLWLVEDQATTSGSTVFIKLSFHFRWFKWTLNLINPLLWCELLWWCPSHTFFFLFFMFFYFMFCSLSLSLSPPPSFFLFFFVLFFNVFIQYASRRFPGSFSLIISPNSGFSFCYVSSMTFFLKRHFRRHACISTQK